MTNQEEILNYFKTKANDIISKYSVNRPSPDYGNQFLRLSSYFGNFNENMVEVDKELGCETANVLATYVSEEMDIALIIDKLCAYSQNAKVQYIHLNTP